VLQFAAAALRPSGDLLVRAGVTAAQLRSAVDQGLVELGSGRLALAHPLLGEVAYGLLLPEERSQRHALLAQVGEDPIERGHHIALSTAEREEAAARGLDEAADDAVSRGDHAGAAGFLLRAAELSPDPESDDAHRRQTSAARELWFAGDVDRAAAICRSLIDRLPPGIERSQVRRLLVECRSGSVAFDEVFNELVLAVQDAAGDDSANAALHLGMAEAMLGAGRVADAVELAKVAIEEGNRAGDPATAVGALALLGFAESMLGLGVTDAALEAYDRWDLSQGLLTSPRMLLACAYIPLFAFDQAEALLQQELAAARERGLEPVEVLAQAHIAESQIRAGRWADALANARTATEHARQAAARQIITGVCYQLGMAEALLGHHDSARAIAENALADAEAAQDFWCTIEHRAVLALIALADGEPHLAVELGEPAWKSMLEHGLGDLSLFPVAPVLGEALVAVGRLDDALVLAETLRRSPVGDLPWCRVIAGRTVALAAAVRGERVAAREATAVVMRTLAELPEPFEQARALEIAGRVERSARNWGAARVLFTDALNRFETLGAVRWADRTAAEIRRLPGRRPADKNTLSPRERDVAELAAGGLTNREIAARLFVSVATVEANLSAVYSKLGLRSRTELANRLDVR
jgi:DNA-binding CsgD family transcriptional regulator